MTAPSIRVAIYLRVSTQDQECGASPDVQRNHQNAYSLYPRRPPDPSPGRERTTAGPLLYARRSGS